AVYLVILACCAVAGRADERIEAAMRAGMLTIVHDPWSDTTSELLTHAHRDCTGRWELHTAAAGGPSAIRCAACNAEHPYTPENRLAAVRENELSARLLAETAKGAAMLARGRKPGSAA